MSNNKLIHFAIYTDQIDRAQSFYKNVFDWGFNTYGPDDFLQIKADDSENGELIGALQARKYSPVEDNIIGLECTIQVKDIEDTLQKVKANGGKIVMPKQAIPHVGYLFKFLDTEGNLLCAMQPDREAR